MITILYVFCFVLVNAEFDYFHFHPNMKGVYSTQKPKFWNIDHEGTLLSSVTENDFNDIYVNGTKQNDPARFRKFRISKSALFIEKEYDPVFNGSSPFTFYFNSQDAAFSNVKGGSISSTTYIIADPRYYRTHIIDSEIEWVGIQTETGGIEWPIDQGYRSNEGIPHINELTFNSFSTNSKGIVNEKGICALTTENNLVCTGEDHVVAAWRAKNQSVSNIGNNFETCATREHLFARKNSNIVWLSSIQELPPQFYGSDFEQIYCTDNLFAARTGSEIFIIDMDDLSTRTVTREGIITFSNFNSITMDISGTYFKIITSTDSNDDYITQEPIIDILNVEKTTSIRTSGFYNGSYLEMFNRDATPQSIIKNNVEEVVTCSEGLVIYKTDKWYVWTHGNNNEYLQSLLDNRILINWDNSQSNACILVQMTDEHTKSTHSEPGYGPQGENNDNYIQGKYSDQESDVILLVISSITLSIILVGLTFYCIKIKI